MQKFFVPQKDINIPQAIITGSDVHHLYHVLRKKVGDEIIIASENQKSFRTQIENITSDQIVLSIIEELPVASQNYLPIILAQGIPRHNKMELIIQKATELGVEEIIPLKSRYSFVNSEGTISQTKWMRWQKICQEATKQCGRPGIPRLHPVTEFSAFFRQIKGPLSLCLLLWEKETHNNLKNILLRHSGQVERVIILIGPEGSFSLDEINLAKKNKFIPVSCIPWILRSETAALFALSVMQYEFNFRCY